MENEIDIIIELYLGAKKKKMTAILHQQWESAAYLRDDERTYQIKLYEQLGEVNTYKYNDMDRYMNKYLMKKYGSDDPDIILRQIEIRRNRQKRLDDLGI